MSSKIGHTSKSPLLEVALNTQQSLDLVLEFDFTVNSSSSSQRHMQNLVVMRKSNLMQIGNNNDDVTVKPRRLCNFLKLHMQNT
jgi:hypothetical protein